MSKVIVHIMSSDSWSGQKLEGKKVYKTVRGAKAFVKRFNAVNTAAQVPSYYEYATLHSIDGERIW